MTGGAIRFKVVATAIAAAAACIVVYATLRPQTGGRPPRTAYAARTAFIRATPRPEAQIVGRVEQNARLVCDSTANHWVRVATEDDSLSGWLHETDVRPAAVRAEATTAPSTATERNPRAIKPSSIDPAGLRSATRVVNQMVAAGVLESLDGPYSIVVGPRFHQLGLDTQEAVCKGVSLVRIERGQTDGFFLKDKLTNSKLGEFAGGRLSMY